MTEGLSREEFEKWVVGYFYDGKRLLTRNGEGYFDDDVNAHWDCWQAASLKQAEPSDEAEPPSQPERCEHGVWIADHCWQCPNTVAESPSQASTQPPSQILGDEKSGVYRLTGILIDAGADLTIMQDAFEEVHQCTLNAYPAEVSQAIKEEWARRIAEFVASKYAGGRWDEEVLALMTNEGEK